MKYHPFDLNILSGNENLISIKGHNFVTNLQKMAVNNPKLDFVNFNAHIKFGHILSISYLDIERKRNFDINQGP